MPNIRVMLWNIQKFSNRKASIPGMSQALAKVIFDANADIVIIVEPAGTAGPAAMITLRNALRAHQVAQGLLPDHWICTWSPATGRERYGFITRDLTVVRPTSFVPNPNAANPPDGTMTNPVTNLNAIRFLTWPNNNWPGPPPPPAAGPPGQPLVNLWVTTPRDRQVKKKKNFSGQASAGGGYAQGIGARLPCLALFHIHTAAGDYYLPIVVCHYWAVRSANARNAGAQRQLQDTRMLHVMQKYAYQDQDLVAPPAVSGGYLDVDNNAVPVRELLVTGDWNMDFLQNVAGGTNVEDTNREAFAAMTPTVQRGGSPQPVMPGAGAVRGPGAFGPAPNVPLPPRPVRPEPVSIPNQALASAVTTQGTILRPLSRRNFNNVVPGLANTAQLRVNAFDLMFYGGTRLNTAAMLTPPAPPNPADAGQVIDVPAAIVKPPAGGALPPAGQVSVGLVQGYYSPRRTYRANNVPNLAAAGGPALTLVERWIGAYLLSDHVPTVIQFVCP
jgi:hypothetical protein